MCVTSAVGDYFRGNLPERHPWAVPAYPVYLGSPMPNSGIPLMSPTRAEFDALKKEVEELRELLKAAKRFDEQTSQPNCELAEKIAIIKQVAKLVGVDMTGVFLGEA